MFVFFSLFSDINFTFFCFCLNFLVNSVVSVYSSTFCGLYKTLCSVLYDSFDAIRDTFCFPLLFLFSFLFGSRRTLIKLEILFLVFQAYEDLMKAFSERNKVRIPF